MLKGIRVFCRQKIACSGANFHTMYFFPSSFKRVFMPNHIYYIKVCSNREKATAEEKSVIGPLLLYNFSAGF